MLIKYVINNDTYNIKRGVDNTISFENLSNLNNADNGFTAKAGDCERYYPMLIDGVRNPEQLIPGSSASFLYISNPENAISDQMLQHGISNPEMIPDVSMDFHINKRKPEKVRIVYEKKHL